MVNTVLLLLFIGAAVATVVTAAMHRELTWKSTLIVAVLAMCGWFIYPPQDNLQLGLDLQGGTSLLYQVDVPEDMNGEEVVAQMIQVLQERVDPQGVRDLDWRPEAGNRIEIQMPQPKPIVQQRRVVFEQAMERLEEDNVARAEVLQTIRAETDEAFATAKKRIIERTDVPERAELLDAARQAQQELSAVQARYDAAGTEDEKIELAAEVLDARQALEAAIADVLATNVDLASVTQALELSDDPVRIRDEAGQVVENPSPRDAALTRLREAHPLRTSDIDNVIEAFEAYEQVRGRLDSPEDLKRLLRGAGVLEFRITVRPDEAPNAQALLTELKEKGPRSLDPATGFGWFKLDNPAGFFDATQAELEEMAADPEAAFRNRSMIGTMYGGEWYALLWDTREKSLTSRNGDWKVSSAGRSIDQTGFNAVSFNMNPLGATFMGNLTGENVGRQMAIVLDGRIYSAPNINSRIEGSGIITGGRGGFGEAELDYLIRTLNAGALKGRLSEEPISERQIGASLGEDNLKKGLESAIDALILVCIFMLLYYFFAGAVANVALLANMVFILGVMAMFNGTFTLPGIAGIVLTIGMCVDANVLIFERIREEQRRGADIDTALRLGYQRAFSSIIDGNLTNLIVALILYKLASADVKGFGLTLTVGIAGTLFTSLFMSRVIFGLYSKVIGIKKLSSLPLAVPVIDKLLEPNWRLLSKRFIFFGISTVVIALSIFAMASRGSNMFDIEFRGGTEVTFALAEDDQGEPRTLELDAVRERLDELAAWAKQDFTAEASPGPLYNEVPEVLAASRREYIDQLAGTSDGAELTEQQRRELAEAATDLVQLGDATVVTVGETDGLKASQFSIVTTVSDQDAVVGVIERIFADVMPEGGPLQFAGDDLDPETYPPTRVIPIRYADLSRALGRTPFQEVADSEEYVGGAAVLLENIRPAVTLEALEARIRRVRNQPDFQSEQYRPFRLVGLERAPGPEEKYTDVAMIVRDPEIQYTRDIDRWERDLATRQWQLVDVALTSDINPGIKKVSNFTPVVAQTIQAQAITALLLSLVAIVVYIWFRFGTARYGLAAIVAVIHDTTIALGLVALAGVLYDTPIGAALLLGPFKINMGLIAALLTIIGYSLNDTIVLFDRIRENRGKLDYATPEVVNTSINQTLSRTLLTSTTTLIAVGTMYIFGGEGIRSFAFCLGIGVVVGTYSSIAIASPVLMIGAKRGSAIKPEAGLRKDETKSASAPATTTG